MNSAGGEITNPLLKGHLGSPRSISLEELESATGATERIEQVRQVRDQLHHQ